MLNLKLEYLKDSELLGKDLGFDTRLWNVVEPRLEGYNYDRNMFPTLGIKGLKERALI